MTIKTGFGTNRFNNITDTFDIRYLKSCIRNWDKFKKKTKVAMAEIKVEEDF